MNTVIDCLPCKECALNTTFNYSCYLAFGLYNFFVCVICPVHALTAYRHLVPNVGSVRKMRKRLLYLAGCIAVPTSVANATLNLSESFDYSGAVLSGQKGGTGFGTKTYSTTSIPLSGDSTSLVFPGVVSAGARISDTATSGPVDSANRTFTTGLDFNVSGATYYVSYLVNKSATGAFNVDFSNSGGSDRWQTGVTASGRLLTGVIPAADATSPVGGALVPNDQTMLIVAKYVAATGSTPDDVYIKAFSPTDTIPSTDAGISYDVSVLTQTTGVKDSILLFNISSGSVQLDEIRQGSTFADVAPATTAPIDFAVASGQTYHFPASVTAGIKLTPLNALSVSGTATVDPALNQSSRQLITVGASFSLRGSSGNWTGLLDLNNNDLDLPGTSPTALADTTDQIAQGYNAAAGGYWNGTGGIISSAAANDSSHLTALGAIQNNQSGTALYSASNPFDGTSPGVSDTLVKYTYFGDANLDGRVDSADYSLIDNGYLAQSTGWYAGDFNYDGVVNGSDYTLIDNAFNTQGGSLSPNTQVASQLSASVPEPGALSVAIGVLYLLSRRKRKAFDGI